jgi:RimJ/RimL family protein N-acetyltransferase
MNTVAALFPRVEMCREEDVRVIMSFIHDSWATNHVLSRDEALFRWQYDGSLRDGRDGAPPTVLLGWSGGRIVGMLGLTYMRWQQAGCIYRGAWTSHWFVAPDFRRSQLSMQLIRRAAQLGAEVIGSVGINDVAMKLLPNMGYESIDEIPRWVTVIDPVKTATLICATGIGFSEAKVLRTCQERSAARPDRRPPTNCDVVEWTDNDKDANDWNAAWERSISRDFTGVVRDSAHIRWRYLRHPTFQYRVLIARDRKSGEVSGMAVSRLETVKGRTEQVLRVLELLTTDRSASDALLTQLVSDAWQAGVAFADFYCTKPVEGLAEAGFRIEQLQTTSFPIPLRLQPLEAGGRPLNAALRLPSRLRGTLLKQLSRDVLYVTKSDGDQDRPN